MARFTCGGSAQARNRGSEEAAGAQWTWTAGRWATGRGIPGAGAARGRRRTAAAASGLSPDPGLTPASFPKGLTAPRMQATLRRNPTTLGLCVLLGAAEKRDVFPFRNTPERRRGRGEQNTVSRFFFWQDRLISFSEEG